MERESDLEYFERRAREERRMAEEAADPLGYRIHTNFARQYEARIIAVRREHAAYVDAPDHALSLIRLVADKVWQR